VKDCYASSSAKRLHTVLYRKVFPLLREYFYNDERRLKLLLDVCNSETSEGFVDSLESKYRCVCGEDPLEDETPWRFHEYPERQLIDALRNTFLTTE
jgi:5-methylcytosine-specific restriction protein B